jgi:hypothetical protein
MDAERPEVRTHAEHGYEMREAWAASECGLMQWLRNCREEGEGDAERPGRRTHAEHGYEMREAWATSECGLMQLLRNCREEGEGRSRYA